MAPDALRDTSSTETPKGGEETRQVTIPSLLYLSMSQAESGVHIHVFKALEQWIIASASSTATCRRFDEDDRNDMVCNAADNYNNMQDQFLGLLDKYIEGHGPTSIGAEERDTVKAAAASVVRGLLAMEMNSPPRLGLIQFIVKFSKGVCAAIYSLQNKR